jgi:lysyl-tRNA synthetase, class I
MFWADEIAHKLDKKDKQLVDDAFSTSGPAHVGSLRGFVIHDIAHKTLLANGLDARFTFILDDFDPVDELPGVNFDKEMIAAEMGKPLFMALSPDKDKSLAEFYAEKIIASASKAGVHPEYLKNSELYRSGQLNDVIRIALDNAVRIREIYKKVTGVTRPEDWYPFQPICENCGKVGTTTTHDWDGETVSYECETNKVDWAKGCGHKGKVSPFNGTGKLYWRVEWPARMTALGVTVEGEGKDHWVAGGSREMANIIMREIYKYPSPQDIRYEFFVIDGKKMSKSKGTGITADEITNILPVELLRYLLAKNPRKEVDFNPAGVTIPNLFDDYDRAMHAYTKEIDFPDLGRAYEVVQEKGFEPGYRMRFSKVALSIQMPKIDIFSDAEAEKGSKLTKYETDRLNERIEYAHKWLDNYAPADFVFKVLDKEPAIKLSELQKTFLSALSDIFNTKKEWSGDDLHSEIHNVKKSMDITPKDAFSAIYLSFLGKESGPQAGWLLASLDHAFVANRLYNISRSK